MSTMTTSDKTFCVSGFSTPQGVRAGLVQFLRAWNTRALWAGATGHCSDACHECL